MASLLTIPFSIREEVYRILLDASPSWISPLEYRTFRYIEDPIDKLKGSSLLLVSRQIHQEACEVLYGRNKFVIESFDISEIRKFLVTIGATNRSYLKMLYINYCLSMESQGNFATVENLFYELNYGGDSDATPMEIQGYIKEMEVMVKEEIVQCLKLFAGAGGSSLRELTLLLPGHEQGRLVWYRYENDFYFAKDLLDDNDQLCAALRAIGPLKKLTLGHTESREVAEQIAREMGVEELTLTWHRTLFEKVEENPEWAANGWTLEPSFLEARKYLKVL